LIANYSLVTHYHTLSDKVHPKAITIFVVYRTMREFNFKNKQQVTIAALVAIVGIAIFTAVGTASASQGAKMSIMSTHIPPNPFKITVNGYAEPALVATVKRGQTAQVDVFISPNISGITGNVEVSSVFPMCGTVDIHQRCTPAGIITTLSANKVTAASHMVVTLNVPSNMPVGMYLFHVVSSTTLNVSFQATPVHVGDSAPFAIQVT
jgi:hypothetical protein